MFYLHNGGLSQVRQEEIMLLPSGMTNKRPIQADDLYRLRLISDPRISPDGTRIAFVLKQMDEDKNEYVSNIYVVDRQTPDDPAPSAVQFTSGDKDSAPRWSPDGKWLAFLSGRKERAQIHLLSTSGGESVALTERKFGAGVPEWSPDSRHIVFTGVVSTDPEENQDDDPVALDHPERQDKKHTAKTKIIERASYKADGIGYIANRRRHIFVLDVASRRLEQITSGNFNDDGAAWSPDGEHLAFASNRSERWDVSLESAIWVIPRAGGAPRRITDGGGFGDPAFSPDGSRIAFTGLRDLSDIVRPNRLFSCNRDGSDLRDEQGDWDGVWGNWAIGDVVQSDAGHGLQWRKDGIYALGTERGESNLYRASGGSVQPITRGAHVITDYSMTAEDVLTYTCSDPTHPAEVFLSAAGQSEQLTHKNQEWLDEVLTAAPERFWFTGARDEQNDGRLLAPRGSESGKHPLIVYIHGGPSFAYGQNFFFEFQFLAGQGFGVFYPNIHGSTSYGAAYEGSIKDDWGNLDFQDVLAGTKAAMERSWVDPRRVGIAGGSYGGYMTLWALGHSDLYRAGVTERCVSNFISFMGTSDVGWIWDRIVGAFPEEDVEKLWDMSPIKYIKNINVPLMVMHSEGDDRTPIEQGEQVFLTLRRLGKETKFVVFPEESHGLSRMGKPSRRVERLEIIMNWFRQWL